MAVKNVSRNNKSIGGSLQVGDVAPDFTLARAPDGTPHTLSSHRGRKVMLSFLRFASCSLCQLDVDHLRRKSSEFERGEVDVICVFQSPPDNIKRYIMRQNPPFACLADPSMDVYKLYNVGNTSKWGYRVACFKFMHLNKPHGGMRRSAKMGFLTPHESGSVDHLLPADFLIDEEGKVVDIFRARTVDEHMPWARIKAFMPVDPNLRGLCNRRGLRGRAVQGLNSLMGRSGDETGGIYMGSERSLSSR